MQTTLFMLMSLDGKISTGSVDDRDFDKDLPRIPGVAEGLHQYYELEKQTDWFSFNTGRVMAKVGWNEPKESIEQIPVIFVIVDNRPHLTELGIKNLVARTEKLYLVTTNKEHPATALTDDKLEVLHYGDHIDFAHLFSELNRRGGDKITIQSGGDMNAKLVREGLIHNLSIVVAPVLVGGRATSTLVDGDSPRSLEDLKQLRPLRLVEAKALNDSYLHVRYQVVKND